MAVLLRSQLECPKCGDLISSIHVHDFQTCSCRALSIDGGRDYLRVSASDEVMELFRAPENGIVKWDRSISIAGEHNKASAAAALVVYKALWDASQKGTKPAPATWVADLTGSVGNGRFIPLKSVSAYLKLFCDDDGPVERTSRGYLPKVPLHERPDA
jgi:hypothetical protein